MKTGIKKSLSIIFLSLLSLVTLLVLRAYPIDAQEFEDGDDGSGLIFDIPADDTPSGSPTSGTIIVETAPTCPANSTLGGRTCTCNSGFIVDPINGNSCVPGLSVCQSKHGPNARYNTEVKKCGCAEGYIGDENKQCVPTGLFCTTNYGDKSVYDITNNKCGCAAGYQFDGKICVPIPVEVVISPTKVRAPIKSNDQVCMDKYGANSLWNGTKSKDGKSLDCACKSGYSWGDTGDVCVASPMIPVLDPVVTVVGEDIEFPLPQNNTVVKIRWYQRVFNWFKHLF